MSELTGGLSLSFREQEVCPGEDLHGSISITYQGRFDSVVISSQIENSSKAFVFATFSGKKVRMPYSRISIFRSELLDAKNIEFTASTSHVPDGEYSNAKFRASIIQEHKEVDSDVVRIKVVKKI